MSPAFPAVTPEMLHDFESMVSGQYMSEWPNMLSEDRSSDREMESDADCWAYTRIAWQAYAAEQEMEHIASDGQWIFASEHAAYIEQSTEQSVEASQ